MVDLEQARQDLGAFAAMIGRRMEPWQLQPMRLESRFTVVVSPRQCGKSRSLATLAAWWAFTRPGSLVLIVSAGEDAALRLQKEVRNLVTTAHVLRGSVVDERAASVTLTNGSEVKCVPASEKAIRGHRVSLLLVDEATQVDPDVLLGAALPTVAAQADGRVVLASSPLGAMGPFFEMAQAGEAGDADTRTFRWRRADAWWLDAGFVEASRRSMSPQRFRAEFDGEFVMGSGDFIDPEEIRLIREGAGALPTTGVEFAVGGLDPAFSRDLFGCAVVGRLRNVSGVASVAFVEGWQAHGQVRATLKRAADVFVRYGVSRAATDQFGAAAVKELMRTDHRFTVEQKTASRESNMRGYLDLRTRLLEGTLEIPNDPALLRELGALRTEVTDSTERIVQPRGKDGHGDRVSAVVHALSIFTGAPKAFSEDYAESDRAPAVRRGDMTLEGERYLDVGPGGELVPPPGWAR